METPEDKNNDASQPMNQPQEELEQEAGSAFGPEPHDASEGEQSQEEPWAISVVPVEPKRSRRSWFQRLMYGLFSPETRAGRFMRPFLRGVALFVGAFALGMLLTYVLILQPVSADLQTSQSQLAATKQQLQEAQSSLTSTKTENSSLNSQVTSLNQQVGSGKTRVHLLLLTTDVKNAQLALLNKDGPNAQKALEAAKQELTKIQPALEKLNPSVAEGIKLRLDLATSELIRDPKTAQSDLDILNTNLVLLDDLLAKQFD